MGTLCLVLILLHLPWSLCSSVSSHLCLPNQRDALLEFDDNFSIDCRDNSSSPKTESWNKSSDCCSWQGVKCDKVIGHVIGIDLSRSCLDGPLLPNNTLFHLHNLQWLDLSSNQLYGPLFENTSSLFHFHQLRRLNLAHNFFRGDISSKLFSQLVSLTHLNLSHNEFSGLIPYQIGLLSSLVSLDLSYNGLSGLVPYQISHLSSLVSLDLSSIGVFNFRFEFDGQGFDMLARNLTKLTKLVLDKADISDVSVTSFRNLSSSLEHLSLIRCRLHGEFPTQVFQLPNLKHLDLGENEKLTGYLPNTNLSSALEFLDLHDCGFRGSIPSSFGNLTQIISIDLSKNWFEGQIPDVFGNLSKLTSLSFSSCNLSGPLPKTMFNLTKITRLDLSHNHLEGPLPNHVSGLQVLEELGLSYNSISGGVPSWLFTLPSLPDLDLSNNKLAGPIDRIQKPSSVQHVDLSYNDIVGTIADSIFGLANLTELHLSSNNLSGVIKSDMLAKLTSLDVLDLSNNGLLSLSTTDNDVNHSFPQLRTVLFSSCSVRQFPNFFRTSKLEILDLSNNKLTGGISKWEAQGWEALQVLNLSYNFLTSLDQFPGKSLRIVDLRSNLLEGPILSNVLNLQIPNPQFLYGFLISENKLTGNIPSSVCNWTSLIVLDLSKNSLSGTIPKCLGNFSYDLKFMDLQMNNLSGKIPDSFVNNDLSHLFLNDNQLEGLVPKSLANSSSLQLLNLGKNKLSDRFPHWLASLPSLQVLILRFNRFHGSLPHSIASSNFSALRILDLSGNEFSGTLPKELFQNLRAMTDKSEERPSYSTSYNIGGVVYDIEDYHISVNITTKRLELELTKTIDIFVSLDLSNNQFFGQVPEEVGQLISLQMLNFSHNNFTGPIPTSFGNLVALESFDLSSNKLGGRIPSQMTKLTFLAVLNLSENGLVGPIPQGSQFNTFDNDSYSGNLGLCDFPLSKQCINHGEAEPPAPLVVEHEDINALPFIWKVVMMGYGSGVVLGLSLGYIVFTTGRPWWFVRMVERDWQPIFTKWIRRNKARRN